MALVSPMANLFEAILKRLMEVPELRYIDQDLGQLENYEMRPAVAWPCCLIDIDEFSFTESQNQLNQMGSGIIQVRLGLVKYTDANNLTAESFREAALQYYELEHKVHAALHGWAPEGVNPLLRRAAGTEKREDDIRVRVVRYSSGFQDNSAQTVKRTVSRPGAVIGKDITTS